MPSPYDHLDLVSLLKAWRAWKKATVSGYGLTRFAKRADCSNSHVYNVFAGERALTDAFLPRFTRALGYRDFDATYVGLLASLSSSTSITHRAHLLRQMSAMHAQRDAPMPEGLAYSTLMEPENLVLFEAAGAPGFRADPDWVAAALSWERETAAGALAALQRAGLLVPAPGGGVSKAQLNFALPARLSAPPVEVSQLTFLERSAAALTQGVQDRAGRALGLLLRASDREVLSQVAAALFYRLHLTLDMLSRATELGPGPYVVYTLQATAAPISRALSARPA